jgi:hypothetical protein
MFDYLRVQDTLIAERRPGGTIGKPLWHRACPQAVQLCRPPI